MLYIKTRQWQGLDSSISTLHLCTDNIDTSYESGPAHHVLKLVSDLLALMRDTNPGIYLLVQLTLTLGLLNFESIDPNGPKGKYPVSGRINANKSLTSFKTWCAAQTHN